MKPLLHPTTQHQLEVAQANPGGYVFFGPRSVGKFTAAVEFARQLNCLGDTDSRACAHCLQFRAGNFPDLIILKPEEKISITVEQVRNLSKTLALSAYGAGTTRIVIVDQAHELTHPAQNALLKLLEEPPQRTRFLLVTPMLDSLLPTVQSRLGRVYFSPLVSDDISEYLVSRYQQLPDVAHELAELGMGLPGLAIAAMRLDDLNDDSSALMSAKKLLGGDIFTRLMWIKQTVDAKADVNVVMRSLQVLIGADMQADRASLEVTAQRLEALKTYYLQTDANVGNRVALERLAVEL